MWGRGLIWGCKEEEKEVFMVLRGCMNSTTRKRKGRSKKEEKRRKEHAKANMPRKSKHASMLKTLYNLFDKPQSPLNTLSTNIYTHILLVLVVLELPSNIRTPSLTSKIKT